MMKCQIGLGVLSLPAAFDVLGLIPGIISLLAIAVTTTWSSYELGVFKLNHPQVYGFHDSMGMVFGRWGHELFSVVFSLCKLAMVVPLMYLVDTDLILPQILSSPVALLCSAFQLVSTLFQHMQCVQLDL